MPNNELVDEFLSRIERGEKLNDVIRDLDKAAKTIATVVKFVETHPPGTSLPRK
jgi:hypothetical protein